MKHIVLLTLLVTLSFAMNRNIVLGSYSQNINAQEALNKAKNIIDQDAELAKNMHDNNSTLTIKKIGDFDSVIITNLKNYREVLHTLDAVHKHYQNAYIVPPYRDAELMRYRDVLKKELIKSAPKQQASPAPKKKEVQKTIIPEPKPEPKKVVVPEPVAPKPTLENIMKESEEEEQAVQVTPKTQKVVVKEVAPVATEQVSKEQMIVKEKQVKPVVETPKVEKAETLHVEDKTMTSKPANTVKKVETKQEPKVQTSQEIFRPTVDEGFTSYQLFLMALIVVLLLFVIVSFILSTRQKS